MAPLRTTRRLGLALALCLATPAHAENVASWEPHIREASRRFGVPTAWIERVMRAESAGRTTVDGRPIRSPVGAIGLMQLMPATWAAMRDRLGLGTDPDQPRDNILAGTFYLRLMFERFGYPGLFAAYNAGPARYAAYLAGGRPLPAETRGYLASVAPGGLARGKDAARLPRVDALFAIRAGTGPASGGKGDTLPPNSLFAPLSQGR